MPNKRTTILETTIVAGTEGARESVNKHFEEVAKVIRAVSKDEIRIVTSIEVKKF